MKKYSTVLALMSLITLFLLVCSCGPKKPSLTSYRLEITIEGQGEVSPASGNYEIASSLTLKAIPAPNWYFKGWEGENKADLVENENSWLLLMNSHKKLKAVFLENDYSLNITCQGEGTVTKTPEQDKYRKNTLVTLEANPASGWNFSHWALDLQSSESLVQVRMDQDKNIEAVFKEKISGEGSARVSGQISLSHHWPYPNQDTERTIARANKDTAKLKVLNYASRRAQGLVSEKYSLGELIIGFKKNMLLAEEERQFLKAAGLTVLQALPAINAYLVSVPEFVDASNVQLTLAKTEEKLLALTSNIAYLEPNYQVQALGKAANFKIPNDPLYHYQWNYPSIRLPQAWTVTTGSRQVRIAVLDTGVAVAHPDLGDNIDIDSAWNFVDDNYDFTDRDGHGSHCIGTIAANTNNSEGVAGVMWQASLIPLKVLRDDGKGLMIDVATAVLYAAGLGERPLLNPAQVISMSLGANNPSQALKDACNAAYEAGVIVLAAAGNSDGPVYYPAAHEKVIAVGASDYNYPYEPQKAPYSCYGPELDVLAPGGDMTVDSDEDNWPDGIASTTFSKTDLDDFGYWYLQGTSMACPHLAGVVGLMLANGVPANEVRATLERTAFDLGTPGFDYETGHGLVNAYWAVENVQEIKIMVGTKHGSTIDVVAETSVDLRSEIFYLDGIPDGDYYVFAGVDVQKTGSFDPGDYFFASELLSFIAGEEVLVDISLEEILP